MGPNPVLQTQCHTAIMVAKQTKIIITYFFLLSVRKKSWTLTSLGFISLDVNIHALVTNIGIVRVGDENFTGVCVFLSRRSQCKGFVHEWIWQPFGWQNSISLLHCDSFLNAT